ncbi:MAG: TolC family protein [Elusimicrobiaceae bacterium]|nr:TolC family protein [Elusimicrobiaceae bacterium]
MKPIHALSVLLLFVPAITAKDLPVQDISIEQAVVLALENNTSVVDAQYTSDIYEAQIREYKSYAYPSVTLSAGYTRNLKKSAFFMAGQKIYTSNDNAYSGNIQLDQIVWGGGKVRAAIKMSEILSEQGQTNTEILRRQVARSVRQICYNIMAASATVEIESEAYTLANLHLDEMREKFDKGLVGDIEVTRQEVEVSNKVPAVIEAENLVETGLLSLNTLLGRDPQNPINITDTITKTLAPEPELDELYALALQNRTELKASKLAIEMAKAQMKLKKGGFYPDIYAFMLSGYSASTDKLTPDSNEYNFSTSAGLNLSYPLFQSGRTVAQVKQADLAYQQSIEDDANLVRQVKSEVKQAWLDYRQALRRVNSQLKSTEQARKVVHSDNLRYLQGLASQLELNDATLALNKAQLYYVTAMRDAFVALAQIKWATGE